jgi:hypothetical protein
VVSQSGEQIYGSVIQVGGKEDKEVESAFEGGSYDAYVSVDDSLEKYIRLEMSDCNPQTIYITITPNDFLLDKDVC